MIDEAVLAAGERLLASFDETENEAWEARIAELEALRDRLSAGGDAESADAAWFMLTVAQARAGMSAAYRDIRDGHFKRAWDALEQTELRVADLIGNPVLPLNRFKVKTLAEMVRQWQGLFPSRVFASPELLITREECTICGQDAGPWSTCQHMVGRVYCGKLCGRIARDFKLLGISMVLDPVQKYSAMIPSTPDGKDPLNYQRVKWVAERLTGPFSCWRAVETTKVFPRERFESLQLDDVCPCLSGMTYRACCSTRDGVRMPHTQIYFSEPIPAGLPTQILVHSAARSTESEDNSAGSA